jgi:predicted nucleic acid-binding protein/GNAT superfamily N-acetyltransferase
MCRMVTVEIINERSPHLETVKQLARQHKKNLGPMPAGAFDEAASEGHILVALDDDKKCVGYLFYRVARDRASITHFCVASEARRTGVARALRDRLVSLTKHCRRILLWCRRDYEASKAWPRLGFHAAMERAGRAVDGSVLVCWQMDHDHPEIFGKDGPTTALQAAMDSNIFLDFVGTRNEETEGLRADWIRPFLTLCYTAELLNDLNRNQDGEARKKRRAEAQHFEMLPCSPDAFVKAEAVLKPLFPSIDKTQDESDYRHLVRALAAEADVFVTGDKDLLARADDVYAACGLPVVRPAELIGRIDIIEHEREYQRNFVAGTRRITIERVNCVDDAFVAAIQAPDEPRWKLQDELNVYLADPQHHSCYKMTDSDGATLASFVVQRENRVDRVPMLRVCAKRQAGTLARSVLVGLVRQAVKAGRQAVLITDSSLSDIAQAACNDLGFLVVADGRLKIIVSGWLAIDDLPAKLTWSDPRFEELKAALTAARTDAAIATKVEHILWPAKLSDACLPCFIVPIRPQFAEHLFEERLASGGLFGADADLALNPESAYYRAAKPAVLTCPARVLWYVSESDNYHGSKSIRACSRLVELAVDTPKRLFSRFRRLGVYEWSEVCATAKGDLNKQIMAFQFDDTELLPPIAWAKFQAILKAKGINNNLQGPVAIPASVFGEIHAAAFDQT